MTIQIFGTKKSSDSKKAERFFKERKITVQFIDLNEKPMSKGEFNSVCQALGGIDNIIDESCKDKELMTMLKYLVPDDKMEKLLANPKAMKLPVVRNGKQATVGNAPEVWKSWLEK